MPNISLSKKNISLDLQHIGYTNTVYAQQGDSDSRQLMIRLFDNGRAYIIPSNASISLCGTRADGTIIYRDVDNVNGNEITIIFKNEELAVSGIAKYKIEIKTVSDDGTEKLLTSALFKLKVYQNIYDENGKLASPQYSDLKRELDAIHRQEDEILVSERERKEKELERKNNEDLRKQNETNRIVSETERSNNEKIRVSNEQQRIVTEERREQSNSIAIANAEQATAKTLSVTNNLQNKLDSHHFVLTEDKDTAGGVAGLDANSKISNNKLYEASASTKGITQLDDSVTSNLSSKAATSKAVKTAYDRAVSADTALQTHNSSSAAHDDMRNLISDLTTRLNALADSDDTTLDQLSEIVAYIKNNKSLIDNVTTSKVNVSDIIDSLTSTSVNKPLSAKQGKALHDLITALTATVQNKVDKISGKGLSTNDYTTAEKNKLASITSGAETNVQADWNTTDTSSGSYIKNKPSLDNKVNKTGDDMSGELVLKSGSMVAREIGTSGVYGYVKMIQIKILRQYVNYPLIFEITGRGWTSSSKLYVQFKNDSSSDPELSSFLIDKTAPYKVVIVKSGTSTWDIYMQKSESYGMCAICSMFNTNYTADAVQITFPDTVISTLPDGAVDPTVITWDKAKNADALGGMNKNQFVHRENPIFDGNLNCRKNIWFNGEAASKLMVEFLESGDANGHGISIGGGGMTVIGGGESANEIIKYYTNNRTIKNGGAEKMIIGNDENIDFFTNCQTGFASAKHITMNKDGTITAEGFNGNITSSSGGSSYLSANKGRAIINSTAAGTAYNALARMKSNNGVWTLGHYNGAFRIYYTDDDVIASETNAVTHGVKILGEDGSSAFAFTNHTHSVATQSSNGLMSASDKKKLDELSAAGRNQRTLVTLPASTEASKTFTLSGKDICKGLKLYFYYHSNSSQGSASATLVKTVLLTQSALTDNAISVNGKDIILNGSNYVNIVKGYLDTTTSFNLTCKCSDINNAPLYKISNVSFSFGFGSPTSASFSIEAVDL